MAIEKNPNDPISKENVIQLNIENQEELDFPGVNFEVDPETGDLEVEFETEFDLTDVDNIVEFNIEDEFLY